MPKVPKLKNPDSLIQYGGRTIGTHNITLELYEELVRIAPGHADLFDLVEEEVKETPKRKATE
jgi:hypothetical protein